MRTIVLALAACALAAADVPPPLAGGDLSGRFGLGLMVGSPVAVTGKWFLDRTRAIDAALGSSEGFGHPHVHADLLWHFPDAVTVARGRLPLYVGAGARLRDDDDGLDLGPRAPAGVAYWFDRIPLELFGEVALILNLVDDGDAKLDLDADVAVGARWYF